MAYKLGRQPKKFNARTLKLGDYLTQGGPPMPPAKVYWEYLVRSWPMFLNDQLGDCVFACGAHMLQNWSAHTEGEVAVTNTEVEAAYSAVGGYVPGDPSTDHGAAITDFLAYWQKTPLAGKTIDGWAEVNLSSLTDIQAAIYLFGGIDIGFNVPQSAMDQFDQGVAWDLVDNDGGIIGGHSVAVLGFGREGCACVTWGKIQYMSSAFFTKYCDEAYAIISLDWLNSQGVAPSHLNLAALQAALAEVKA